MDHHSRKLLFVYRMPVPLLWLCFVRLRKSSRACKPPTYAIELNPRYLPQYSIPLVKFCESNALDQLTAPFGYLPKILICASSPPFSYFPTTPPKSLPLPQSEHHVLSRASEQRLRFLSVPEGQGTYILLHMRTHYQTVSARFVRPRPFRAVRISRAHS